MRRALALAAQRPARRQSRRSARCILSPDGDVLAEGWHRGAGTVHAEVDALSQLAGGAPAARPRSSPSSPATTPAAPAPAREALSPPVSRAWSTPSPTRTRVAAGGAERLRAAGVDVDAAACSPTRATSLLASWLTVQRLGRPHVTVKWAQSLDGRAAASDGTSQWITGPGRARRRAPPPRADADAIVVGTGTVLADDPALTARGATATLSSTSRFPVVLGERAFPADAALRRHPRGLLAAPAAATSAAVLADLRERGIAARLRRGRPDARERVPRGRPRRRGARLRRARAARRRRSSPSATSASTTIAEAAAARRSTSVEIARRRPADRRHRRTQEGRLTDVHRNHRGDRRSHRRRTVRRRRAAHGARDRGGVGCRARRLDRGQRRVPHRRRPGRRTGSPPTS